MTNEQKASRLLPCPFCAGEAYIEQTGKDQITVGCKACVIKRVQKCLRYGMEWHREKQIAAWNTRAKPQAMGVDLDKAIKQCQDFAEVLDEEGMDRDGLHIAIYTVCRAAAQPAPADAVDCEALAKGLVDYVYECFPLKVNQRQQLWEVFVALLKSALTHRGKS